MNILTISVQEGTIAFRLQYLRFIRAKVMTDEILYNIGLVTRLTGIPASTLHAWERRYDYPHAHRSAGGHRLYTEQDIQRLRWVKAQVDSGLAVSRAITAARSHEADGSLFQTGSGLSAIRPDQFTLPLSHDSSLLEMLFRHDLKAADQMLGELLAFHSPEDLTLNVIGPALRRIGEAWEQGRISIATEHLASNYLRHRLLAWMVTGPLPKQVAPVILACAPGEWHEGSLLILGVLLRRRGWPVSYLGQNTPLHDLSNLIEKDRPQVVVLIAMLEEPARYLADWPKQIVLQGGKPVIAFGGRAFIIHPELKHAVMGEYLGDTLQEGLERLGTLLEE
jgi:MerR family transcriptional regulator, light-induced transcriptional regulator